MKIICCIAALLVPLQHKLEKWATHKLVEKNKAIRLASAKKQPDCYRVGRKNKNGDFQEIF